MHRNSLQEANSSEIFDEPYMQRPPLISGEENRGKLMTSYASTVRSEEIAIMPLAFAAAAAASAVELYTDDYCIASRRVVSVFTAAMQPLISRT